MEIGGCEMDAKLLERFGALGTVDKEDLLHRFKTIIGDNISSDSCRFYLELAGWNLQRAVGAYFDFSFENSSNPAIFTHPTTSHAHNVILQQSDMTVVPPSFDLRILPSSISTPKSSCVFNVSVEVCGSSHLVEGCFMQSESDVFVANLATRSPSTGQIIWLPIGANVRVPLLPASNSLVMDFVINLVPPEVFNVDANAHIVGGLSFCLPSGERFGETLYFTAIPDVPNQRWLFQQGIVDNFEADSNTPMEEV